MLTGQHVKNGRVVAMFEMVSLCVLTGQHVNNDRGGRVRTPRALFPWHYFSFESVVGM
jgi:hypothetical protein